MSAQDKVKIKGNVINSTIGAIVIFVIYINYIHLSNGKNVAVSPASAGNKHDYYRYEKLLRSQNQTISTLMELLDSSMSRHLVKGEIKDSMMNKIAQLVEKVQHKDSEIERLVDEIEVLKQNQWKGVECNNSDHNGVTFSERVTNDRGNAVSVLQLGKDALTAPVSECTGVNSRAISLELHPPLSQMEDKCEKRYGLELIHEWRKSRQVFCSSEGGHLSAAKSELVCYPYKQAHKSYAEDIFCEATNFVVDFSKIKGSIPTSKPPLGSQYLEFAQGSLQSACSKTQKMGNHFMPHHALQMRSFQSDVKDLGTYTTVDTTTYLLARDEDCENSFHSTADFMNMYLVMNILGISPSEQQVILFDRNTDGPYMELINKAYSHKHPVIRHTHYSGKVMFKRLVFHLESPAGLIFPKVSRPDPLRCFSTSFFQAYRKFVLKSFDLYDVMPPAIPVVTLSLRHRTAHKNVGRILDNEQEIIEVLRGGNMMDLNVVDTAKMSYAEQLKMVRQTNVLVGVHGAGLMFIMFAAEEAVLVEIHPSYRQDRHFRHAARMTGKIYMPMRSLSRETCQGTSDNVKVPIDEFKKTMDGALRIARSFDDGLSECGLVCPTSILALDERLNPHYKSRETRGQAVNTHFPCG